ncbi:MAG: hypothetical protein K6G73_09810 [Marinilabiliaceae bacterium]|nr:hypothetical protein [Marinilabiliaceae bacterium]
MFLEAGLPAWQIAVDGFPLFSISFVFFTLNIVLIGYYQALEKARMATVFMLLRGYVFVVPTFILLPLFIGSAGLWLATPLSEMLTLVVICIFFLVKSKVR